MSTMAPGHELSEVEVRKWLNAYQWDAIARRLGRPTYDIVGDAASGSTPRW
jgi:hypothetical protein